MFIPAHPRLSASNARTITKTDTGAPDHNRKELSNRLDDYVLRDRLGNGAFGDVFLAESSSTSKHRFVAVKVVRRSTLVKESTKMLLATEVQSLRHLSSTGSMFFTQLHEAFCDAHNFYIVTDFLRGGTLRDEMTLWRGNMKSDRILFVMSQFVEALSQLRASRIIHRDLKPENVLLDALGNITIADLGISRMFECKDSASQSIEELSEKYMTDAGCGTMGYVAPEIHRRDLYSFPVDVYSIGVIFYEMLFGRLPYAQKDFMELNKAIMDEDWTVPMGLQVDPVVLDLCSRLLAKQPSDRIDLDGLRKHAFFKNVDWVAIAARAYDLPEHYAPLLKPIKKEDVIDLSDLIDLTTAVPDEWDAVHPVVGPVEAEFSVKSCHRLVSRPANPRGLRSRVSKAFRRVTGDIVYTALKACDGVLGREGRVRRRDWAGIEPKVGDSYLKVMKEAAVVAESPSDDKRAVVEKVEVEEPGAGEMFSVFDCSIVAVETYVRPATQQPARPALRRVTTRIPARPRLAHPTPVTAPVVKGKRMRPTPLRIDTALPVRRPSFSPSASPSSTDASFVFARALEIAMPPPIMGIPSLGTSVSTLLPTPGPVTPTGGYFGLQSVDDKAMEEAEMVIELSDSLARGRLGRGVSSLRVRV